jgi:hypothetical protein
MRVTSRKHIEKLSIVESNWLGVTMRSSKDRMKNTHIVPTTSDQHTQTLLHLTSRPPGAPPGALELRRHATLPCHVCGGYLLFLRERECVVRPSPSWLREVRLQIDLFCLNCFERRGSLTRVFKDVWPQCDAADLDQADHQPEVDTVDVTFLETTTNVVDCYLELTAVCGCGVLVVAGLDARFDLREFV